MMADKLPSLAIVWLLPDFFVNLVMCQHLVYVLKKVQENLILGFRERDLPPFAEYRRWFSLISKAEVLCCDLNSISSIREADWASP